MNTASILVLGVTLILAGCAGWRVLKKGCGCVDCSCANGCTSDCTCGSSCGGKK